MRRRSLDPTDRPARVLPGLLSAVVAATLAAVAGAPAASAAAPQNDWSCRAETLDLRLAGAGVLDPIEDLLATGSDDAACRTSTNSPLGGGLQQVLNVLRPLGVDVGLLTTSTTTDVARPVSAREPEAYARVAGLDVSLAGVTSLVKVGAVESRVQARCADGVANVTSTFDVADVRVFGQRVNLTDAVVELSGALGPLGPVVRLTPGDLRQTAAGTQRTGLRVEVLQLGVPLLDVSVAVSRVAAGADACATASAAAPEVEGRTITAEVAPAKGATVERCSFAVTPPGGGSAVTVDGTFADGRCTAQLSRQQFPPGDDAYRATVTVVDSASHSATSPEASFRLAPPRVEAPTVNGREVASVVVPGAGATIAGDACALTVAPAGGAPTAVPAKVETDAVSGVQRCVARLPEAGFPPGEYAVVATVTDSLGDEASGSGTIAIGGPEVANVRLDGRTARADFSPASGTTIESCRFELTLRPDGPTKAVAGTVDVDGAGCSAALPAAQFPPGTYDVVGIGVDSDGGSAQGQGSGTIAGPVIGDVAQDGRDLVVAEVAPGTDATIDAATGCEVALTAVGGGPVALGPVTYDAAQRRCVALLPADLASGDYDVTTTVTDSDGGVATATERVRLAGGPAITSIGVDERDASATIVPADGRTIAGGTCSFALTPKGGGATTTIEGTVSGTTCTATLPESSVPDGEYDVAVTASDSAGFRSTATSTAKVPGVPVDATVGPPTLVEREVRVTVLTPGDSPVERCSVQVAPKAGGASVTLPGTFVDGVCRATLPREQFPPGTYDARVTLVQANGREVVSAGEIVLAGPTVGEPVVVGPVVAVPATPGSGGGVTSCSITVTPAGGGAPVTVAGYYDAAAKGCAWLLPPEKVPSGDYDAVITVRDSNGDEATKTSRITVVQPGADRQGTPPPTTSGEVAQDFLACAGGTSALINVRQSGNRARVSGVALERLAGKTVQVQLYQPGRARRTAARTTVGRDGQFSVLAVAPRNPPRATRYRVVVDGRASRTLRLVRRTLVSKTSVRNGRVTITGRITKPYPRVGLQISVQRRVDCKRYDDVATTTVRRNGRYSFSFTGIKGRAYLYRVQTRVPSRKNGPSRSRSFSLPQIVVVR